MQKLSGVFILLVVGLVLAACAPRAETTTTAAAQASTDTTAPRAAGLERDLPPGTRFQTLLDAINEVPPAMSAATGEVEASLDGNMLTLQGTFEGLSSALRPVAGTPAHIHMAPEGENGPVVFPVEVFTEIDVPEEGEAGYSPRIVRVLQDEDDRTGVLQGRFELNEDQLDALMAGNLYVNVHTEMYPGGEIRGQLTEPGK